MFLIDKYSYTNRLKDFNPMIKFTCCIFILIFGLINKNLYLFGALILLLGLFTMYVVRISLAQYLRFLTVPLAFLIVSIITLIFSAGTNKDLFIASIKISNSYYIGLTRVGINNGVLLFFRVICSISATYLLALTIPMNQLIAVFKCLRLPKTFIEMTILIYRFIFIFLEECKEMYVAQDLRFGYINLKTSYNSTALIIKLLFFRVMNRYEELNISLETKLYNGEFYI